MEDAVVRQYGYARMRARSFDRSARSSELARCSQINFHHNQRLAIANDVVTSIKIIEICLRPWRLDGWRGRRSGNSAQDESDSLSPACRGTIRAIVTDSLRNSARAITVAILVR